MPACLLDRQLRYRRVNAGWAVRVQGRQSDRPDPPDRPAERSPDDADSFLADLPPERRARWAAALGAILAGRLGHFVDEAVEPGPAGERRVVTTACPAFGPDGTIEGVVCLRYELADGREPTGSEEQLIQVLLTARRLQHFLGNQLALTLGYVELLTFDPRLPDELRDRLGEALRGVVEATETLSRLRQLTRLELAPDDPSLAAYAEPE